MPNTDLKLSWLDSPMWSDLFRQNDIRSPAHTLPCTSRDMRKYLKKVDISATQFSEYTGFSSLGKYQEANPRVPLRAFLGTMLEAKHAGML